MPQTGHPLLGQRCRALTSPSPLPTTCAREAQGPSDGRTGRTEQRLPEITVTGTGSQHSLFINLRTTESKDSISAVHPTHSPWADRRLSPGAEAAGLGTRASPEQSSYRTLGREARSPPPATPPQQSVPGPPAPKPSCPRRAVLTPWTGTSAPPEDSHRGSAPCPAGLGDWQPPASVPQRGSARPQRGQCSFPRK